MIEHVSLPIIINKFHAHNEIKTKLLSEFNSLEKINSPSNKSEFIDIDNGDWDERWDKDRSWHKLFLPDMMQYLDSIIDDLGYSTYLIKETWYQQYSINSFHGWHVHDGSLWSNIYYVELDSSNPPTEFYNPLTKNILKFDIKEGDIITFPSLLIHRSAKNTSKKRKTIISWNLDTDISPNNL